MADYFSLHCFLVLITIAGIHGRNVNFLTTSNGCPATNIPGKDVFLPAEDCQHFYKCDHGRPVLMPCPVGQEWSQELERCDWPEVAQCSAGSTTSTSTQSPTTTSTSKPSTTTKKPAPSGCPATNPPGEDVFLPAEDCQHFYKCDHGRPVLMPCPVGQEWSQELKRCDWPEVAQCSAGSTTSTSTQATTTTSTTKPSTTTTEKPAPSGCPPTNPPGEDVFLPAEDCQHFYKCDHGRPVLMPCPVGQEWSQELKRCDWPEVAQCSAESTTSTSTQATTTTSTTKPSTTTTEKPAPSGCPPTNPPGEDVFLPAEDCQHFYKCDHGRPVLMPCPVGQEWSQELKQCDWPEIANCSRP